MNFGPDVLSFYKEMPFNYGTTAFQDALRLRNGDPILAYPPLVALLKTKPEVLDIGCGTGWLPISAAYRYGSTASGVDFNPVAIDRASETARLLNVAVSFEVADLFRYAPRKRVPLVTSIGALHHTDDCLGAIAYIAETMVEPGGRIFIGLYHRYGRRPFLSHFARMKDRGATVDEMFAEFCRLRASTDDDVFLRSWFRDQVMHPHETQHTLAEFLPLLDDLGFELESTSINRFGPVSEVGAAAEMALEEHGQAALAEGRYFPGFFVFMARRRT